MIKILTCPCHTSFLKSKEVKLKKNMSFECFCVHGEKHEVSTTSCQNCLYNMPGFSRNYFTSIVCYCTKYRGPMVASKKDALLLSADEKKSELKASAFKIKEWIKKNEQIKKNKRIKKNERMKKHEWINKNERMKKHEWIKKNERIKKNEWIKKKKRIKKNELIQKNERIKKKQAD